MNLTIDIGNTATKIIVFDDTVPVYRKVVKVLSPLFIKSLLKRLPVEYCLLSSVVKVKQPVLNTLSSIKHFQRLKPSTLLPLKNRYKTPSTLGNDRLANAIAGAFLFPGKNVLVIDAGTCIKYDFINSKGEYLGGSISPGMEMRFKSMHQFTGKLPLVKDEKTKKLTGQSTREALQTGVIVGITEEIKGFISRYKQKHKSLSIILTGGDSKRFAEELKMSIFAAADMVNLGLNEIIRHQNQKKKT